MTNNLLFPHASFLGFDNLFQQLERANQHQLPPYPPCNIVKHGENKIDIEMAVAGFSMDDLDICLLYTSPSPRDATLSRMPSSA